MLLTQDGVIEIAIPRDRSGSFEPQLIAKGQTRFDGFDDKILSFHARGMTVPEIQGHLAELYGTDVSRPHQPGHRRSSRRGAGMAEPAIRPSLIRSCFSTRCGSRFVTRSGQEQGCLRRARP